MGETLKPCPFCGDKAVLKEDLRWHGAFRVECSNCDATVWATGENNPASAIAHWNTRAAPRETGEAERLLEEAWGIIANAGAGSWGNEKADWQLAARRWRDQWLAHISAAAPRPDVSMRQEQGMLDRCPIDPDSRVGRFFATLRVADVDEGPET